MVADRTLHEFYRQWNPALHTVADNDERVQIDVNEPVSLVNLAAYTGVFILLPPVGQSVGKIFTVICSNRSSSGEGKVVPFGTITYATPTDGDDALMGSTVGAGVVFNGTNDRCCVYSDGLHWYVLSSMLS